MPSNTVVAKVSILRGNIAYISNGEKRKNEGITINLKGTVNLLGKICCQWGKLIKTCH